jgi:tail lysozyme
MDNGQSAFNFFVSQGLQPQQAAGIVGNLQGESGQGLNPNAVNPGDGTDGSDSIGIGQWNGDRAKALKDYAASQGQPWNDLTTQLQFLHAELKGPESAAYNSLLAAQTPEQAGQAMLAYERPKDWNKPGAHPERAQYAARAYAAYGGGNAPPGTPAAPVAPTPQAPPIFAQAQPQTAPQAPEAPAQVQAYQAPEIPAAQPMFAQPQRKLDLSKLMAAFKAPNFYAKG